MYQYMNLILTTHKLQLTMCQPNAIVQIVELKSAFLFMLIQHRVQRSSLELAVSQVSNSATNLLIQGLRHRNYNQ
jgi:hypothetical protein